MSETRAGKVLSAANSQLLNAAVGHLDTATDRGVAAGDAHARVADALGGVGDASASAASAHRDLADALTAAATDNNPTDRALHLAAASNAHRQIGKSLGKISGDAERAGAAHDDATAALASSRRAIGAATRLVRGVVDTADYGSTKDIQVSDGIDHTGGATGRGADSDYDFRRRQAQLMALSSPP